MGFLSSLTNNKEQLENDCLTNLLLGIAILLFFSWLIGSMVLSPLAYICKAAKTSTVPIVGKVVDSDYGHRNRVTNITVNFNYNDIEYTIYGGPDDIYLDSRGIKYINDDTVYVYVNYKQPKLSVLEKRNDILTIFISIMFFIVWCLFTLRALQFFIKGIYGLFLSFAK